MQNNLHHAPLSLLLDCLPWHTADFQHFTGFRTPIFLLLYIPQELRAISSSLWIKRPEAFLLVHGMHLAVPQHFAFG